MNSIASSFDRTQPRPPPACLDTRRPCVVEDGRCEPCLPHHSWNSNHLVSNLVVFHLQRHSDHHAHPGRSCQSLRDFPNLPTLPSSYFGMFMLAYVPPLWFAVMNPLVVAAAARDTARINFLPARRQALMRRHGLVAA